MAFLRNFARDLRPLALDDLGVVASVRRLLVDLGVRTGVQWELNTTGTPRRLARGTEPGIFRIVQEAIRNVERHAEANSVSVEIGFGVAALTLRVADDGKGIAAGNCQQQPEPANSLGLLGMRERASLLGGELLLQSQPGQGTTITATIPLRPGG